MNWYKFLKLSQIWITNTEDTLSGYIEKIYELEFKHSTLLKRPFTGLQKRRENILSKLEQELWNAIKPAKMYLMEVYEKWLNSHDTDNASQWAKARINEDMSEEIMESTGYSTKDIIANFVRNYLNTKNQKSFSYQNNFNYYQELYKIINYIGPESFQSLNNLSATKSQEINDEMKYSPLEDINDYYGQQFQTEEAAIAWIDSNPPMDANSLLDMYGMEDVVNMIDNAGMRNEFMTELYQHALFPAWMDKWGQEGIKETTDNLSNIYKMMADANSLPDNLVAINWALHAAHQTGQMTDYINEVDPEVDKGFLNRMSNNPDSERWIEELRAIGVQI